MSPTPLPSRTPASPRPQTAAHSLLTDEVKLAKPAFRRNTRTEERRVPQHQPVQNRVRVQPVQNRVRVLLVHIPKLSIRGQARLASEVGVSRSTISRLVNGRINPSYRLARGVTTALEKMMGRPLDMREVFSIDGTYLTPSGCALCRCGGCLPDQAYDPEGNLRPEWRGQRPGDWSPTPAIDSYLQGGTVAHAEAGKEGK